MKKAKTVPPEAIQFNVRYADITAGAKLLRDELLKNLSFTKKLAKKAAALYQYGKKKCYVANTAVRPHYGIREIGDGTMCQIHGIKNLGSKMDSLDRLACCAVYEINCLADSLIS